MQYGAVIRHAGIRLTPQLGRPLFQKLPARARERPHPSGMAGQGGGEQHMTDWSRQSTSWSGNVFVRDQVFVRLRAKSGCATCCTPLDSCTEGMRNTRTHGWPREPAGDRVGAARGRLHRSRRRQVHGSWPMRLGCTVRSPPAAGRRGTPCSAVTHPR